MRGLSSSSNSGSFHISLALEVADLVQAFLVHEEVGRSEVAMRDLLAVCVGKAWAVCARKVLISSSPTYTTKVGFPYLCPGPRVLVDREGAMLKVHIQTQYLAGVGWSTRALARPIFIA